MAPFKAARHFMIASILILALWLATGAACPAIEVKLRVSIPSPFLLMPVPNARVFSGDDRGFAYDQGTSRAEATVQLPVKQQSASPRIVFMNPGQEAVLATFGRTREYQCTPETVTNLYTSCKEFYHPIGRPSWWLEHRKETPLVVIDSSTHSVTPASLSAHAHLNGPTTVNVHFHVIAANPLVAAAKWVGPIKLELDVAVTLKFEQLSSSSEGPIRVKWTAIINGQHKQFPAYELYVNGKSYYTHTPNSDQGPGHLTFIFPDKDVTDRHAEGDLCTVDDDNREQGGNPCKLNGDKGLDGWSKDKVHQYFYDCVCMQVVN